MGSNHVFDTQNLFKTLPHFPENATLKLLQSSVLVSISCAFRIYLASLLIQANPSILICVAGFLVMYSVYVLDRALDSEEDLVNKTELAGSNKKFGIVISLLAFISGASILATKGMFALAFVPFVTGYLYSKGIKIGKVSLKLKGGFGVKNLVVGITWGVFIAGLAGGSNLLPAVIIFIMYGVKVFINSAIDDFKDIKGDSLAGIKTLPICLGTRGTRAALFALHMGYHAILCAAILSGVIASEPLIVACSFICGLICIVRYTNETAHTKAGLSFFKDGESTITTVLHAIV